MALLCCMVAIGCPLATLPVRVLCVAPTEHRAWGVWCVVEMGLWRATEGASWGLGGSGWAARVGARRLAVAGQRRRGGRNDLCRAILGRLVKRKKFRRAILWTSWDLPCRCCSCCPCPRPCPPRPARLEQRPAPGTAQVQAHMRLLMA